MDIFEQYKIQKIINVHGPKTIYGGSLMRKETINAINDASKYSVNLLELQAVASKIIAEKTHAEAGLVTCGAFEALSLAAASCICGLDVSKMNRLPITNNFPNEFIIPWHQINGYFRSIEIAGGKIIAAGIPNFTSPPNEVIPIKIHDIEAEINENTVGIVYAVRQGSHPPLENIIELARKYKISVIVDAANQIPPIKNLHYFIDLGADLVCISGGKGIRGPQNSGILCGKKESICSAALQSFDMATEPFDEWNPPEGLIFKKKLKGRPKHGVARGAKVSKEAIIGLMVALENLDINSFEKEKKYLNGLLQRIANKISDVAGIKTEIYEDVPDGYPVLKIYINRNKLGKSAKTIVMELKKNHIFPNDKYKDEGIIYIHSININQEITKILEEKLIHILRG